MPHSNAILEVQTLPADAGEAVSWKPMQQMFLTDITLDRPFRNTALLALPSCCNPRVVVVACLQGGGSNVILCLFAPVPRLKD